MTMGKLTILEISGILVEKNKLTPKKAKEFANTMFELVREKLNEEGVVRIKGFGTFKLIRVEARESVSVRTGEHLVIDSHSKITFTPDNTMKELVNKPFSQFDTVILNDGVEFEDIPDEDPEEEQQVVVERPVIEQPIAEQPAAFSQILKEEERTAPKEEPVIEDESPAVEEEKEPLSVFLNEEDMASSWKKTLGYVLLALILMAASAYAGYWYGKNTANTVMEPPLSDTSEVVAEDSVEIIEVDSVDVIVETEEPEPQQEQKEEVRQESKPAPASEEEPFWKKYEAMDVRVRTGAYHIVGTDHEVIVRKGETLSRIARRELGEGMSCYIEVYNGLNANAELKEGQTIKVPKLKWKKKR